MKLLYVLFFAACLSGCAEHKDDEGMGDDENTVETAAAPSSSVTPDAVNTAFAAEFPGAGNPRWEIDNEMYEVTFDNGTKEMTAIYTMSGQKYATEIAVTKEMLPEVVLKAATALGEITEIKQITKADGIVHYGIQAADKDYIFDESGSMIQEHGAEAAAEHVNDDTE